MCLISLVLQIVLILCLSIEFVVLKDLHIKESLSSKHNLEEYIASSNLLFTSTKLKRMSRHVELEKGNVLSHLLSQRQQHILKDNGNHFMKRALKILEMKIRRLLKMKNASRNKTLSKKS